jgi:hypothetical protein
VQTSLRTLGIEITFSREGRAGSRLIRMRTSLENCVSTVKNSPERQHTREPQQQRAQQPLPI